MRKHIGIVCLCILIGAGCTPRKDAFPVLSEEPKAFEKAYFVCQDQKTGDRVYQYSSFGDDSGWMSFYDKNGRLIEETPEMGPGAGNFSQLTTNVENCTRTTEEYFMSKINDD